jgi:hypothetical protein
MILTKKTLYRTLGEKFLFVRGYLMICLFFTGLVLFNAPVKAQSDSVTGSFVGVVYDKNNNPIPNATITFIYKDTGISVTTQTDAEGRYKRNALSSGEYLVKVTVSGFKDTERNHILYATQAVDVIPPFYLESNTVAAVDPNASGSSATPPPPSANPPAPDNSNREGIVFLEARRGGAFSADAVTNLPLGGATLTRSFDELAFYVPGF